jgi:crossover junction endodeoxyribonuclease RuvC
MSITIGVDPGLTGAIALVDSYGVLVAVHDMPTLNGNVQVELLHELDFWFPFYEFNACVIEDVHSMPKQGVASSFKFGRSKGVIEGFFAGVDIPLRYVTPAKWKTDMKLKRNKTAARSMACAQWPTMADKFARVKDDGRAEAALIALWWLHHGDPMRQR